MAIDVYQYIRNTEIRKFFKAKNDFSMIDKMQLILKSYQSIQNKYEILQQLAQEIEGDERKLIEQASEVISICIDQIYNPKDRTLYVMREKMVNEEIIDKKKQILNDIDAYVWYFDNIDEVMDGFNCVTEVRSIPVIQK